MKLLLSFVTTLTIFSTSLHASEPLRVSSFSTILTEIAQQVGGDRVVVTGHIEPGVDPHDFEPKPDDLKTVSAAQVVLLSAKHMEGYVNKLQEATGGKGSFVQVGDGFASLKLAHGHDDHHDHGHSDEDPHWWHSIGNVKKATRIVRDAFAKAAPEDTAVFAKNADVYLAKLDTLEKWVKGKLAELPRNKRKLVTSHDAFGYFAKENGFTIYAVEGLSATEQPSSKQVAATIKAVKTQGVKAIFPAAAQNAKVLEEITRQTGAKIGPELFADGLDAGEGATFEGMMKHNVTAIVEALK